jgi:hypothetical protein
VKRDLPPMRPRVVTSTRAAARFFYLVDAIGKHLDPTQKQLDALESAYLSTASFLSEWPEFKDLLVQIHPHGSRELGTLVRPLDDSREGFDIDLVARLHEFAMRKYGGENGATLLLNHLHVALERYATVHGLRVTRWERCVTLEYAGGMCADIAPVIDEPLIAVPFGDTHGRIPDRKLRLYDGTNPRGYVRMFNEIAAIQPVLTQREAFAKALDSATRAEIAPLSNPDEVFDRLLCRLIQLMKLNRNVAFGAAGKDLAPSSAFITSVASASYAVRAPQPHEGPLDLMLDILQTMTGCFERVSQANATEYWYLRNRTAPSDNLAASMNTPQKQAAFDWWHNRLMNQLTDLLAAIDGYAGMDVIAEKVKVAFGPRAARALQQDQSQAREARRGLGQVALVTATAMPKQVHAKPHSFFGA